MTLISFDIPIRKGSLRKQVNRILHRVNAEMVQKSLWKGSVDKLREIAWFILKNGGKALLVEEGVPPYLTAFVWF